MWDQEKWDGEPVEVALLRRRIAELEEQKRLAFAIVNRHQETEARVRALLKDLDEWMANAKRCENDYELGRCDSLILVRAALEVHAS